MKNKELVLEHGNKMYYSRELVELNVPGEISLMFYTIIALVFVVISLVVFCKVNDVISVHGIVRTGVNNSTVRNVLSGKISEIYYKPEQFVEKGEILYSLDREMNSTIEKQLENKLNACNEQIQCLEIVLEGIYLGKKGNSRGKNVLADSMLNDYFGNLAYYEKQSEILRYRLLKEQNQPDSFYNKQNEEEAVMNYELCIAELEKYKAAFEADLIQRKKSYEVERNGIEQELLRTYEQSAFLDVRAPVSGYVQEMALLNKGDYVSAEQIVLVIVPDDSKSFKVEMSVPTKDIGEIVPEMPVKFRLSAFPFFEYKGAEGKILSVDSDAREGSDGRLYYRVYADIDRTLFTSRKGISYPIKAGIEVDAKIIKEKISVMHFILRKLDFVQ